MRRVRNKIVSSGTTVIVAASDCNKFFKSSFSRARVQRSFLHIERSSYASSDGTVATPPSAESSKPVCFGSSGRQNDKQRSPALPNTSSDDRSTRTCSLIRPPDGFRSAFLPRHWISFFFASYLTVSPQIRSASARVCKGSVRIRLLRHRHRLSAGGLGLITESLPGSRLLEIQPDCTPAAIPWPGAP